MSKSANRNGPWFRMYASILDDPKLAKLTDAQCWGWAKMLALAVVYEGMIPDDMADVSFRLRKPVATVRALIDAFIKAGLLERCEEGFIPHNWEARQFHSDVSTDRVKRFRERSKKRDETVSETPSENTETDTEAEAEKNKSSLRSDLPPAAPATVSKRRKAALPDDLFPNPELEDQAIQFWGAHARFDLTTPEALADQIAQFQDHHRKTGATMADWPAAWRTWFRNALKFSKGSNRNGAKRTGHSAFLEGAYLATQDDALGHADSDG